MTKTFSPDDGSFNMEKCQRKICNASTNICFKELMDFSSVACRIISYTFSLVPVNNIDLKNVLIYLTHHCPNVY